ncbi:hypothetical protein Tco_0409830 [Tanacetum coccineum]
MPNTRSRALRTRGGINEQIDHQMAGALGSRTTARNLESFMRDGGGQEEGNGNGGNRNGNRGKGNGGNRNGGNRNRGNENGGNRNGNGNGGGNGYNFGGFMPVREMVPNEEDKVERFIGGLLDNIQGNLIAAKSINFKMPRHFRKYSSKLGNQNHGNKARNKNENKTGNQTRSYEATARAYAIGRGGENPKSNVVMGTFLLNNCYASMLFDSRAGRNFMSSTFSALLDVAPSPLDTSYTVELADGRILEINVILRGSTTMQ